MPESLFLTDSDLSAIRSRVAAEPWAAELLRKLRERGAPPAPPEGTAPRSAMNSEDGHWIRDKALLYAVTAEDQDVPAIADALDAHFQTRAMEVPLDRNWIGAWGFFAAYARHTWAFDLVREHPLMRGERRDRIESRLREVLAAKKEILRGWGVAPNNTGMWDTATAGVLGFLLQDEEAIEMAIRGRGGFEYALSILDDGLFWPEPHGYALGYVSSCLTMMAEAALAAGYADLYAYRGEGGRSLRSLPDGWIRMALADGRLAITGDGSESAAEDKTENGRRVTQVARLFGAGGQGLLDLFHRRYGDPTYAWLLAQSPRRDLFDTFLWGHTALVHGQPLDRVQPPSAASAVFPNYGTAVVRSDETAAYWNSGAPALFLRKGDWMIHGHNDHFGLVYEWENKTVYHDWFLGWDYCMGCFTGGRNRTPLTPTLLGHNTVMVDRCQPTAHDNAEIWHCAETLPASFSPVVRRGAMKFVSLAGMVYADVFQRRTLGLTRDYLVERFELASGARHLYDYILHGFGELSAESVEAVEPYDGFATDYAMAPVNRDASSEDNAWLRRGRRGTASGDWRAVFHDQDGRGVVAHVAGCPDTQVFLADTPLFVSADANVGRLPILIARRRIAITAFTVVHQPYIGQPAPLQVRAEGRKVTIQGADFEDTIDFATQTYARAGRPGA